MGTSTSFGGPRRLSPLLPSWAQDGGDGPPADAPASDTQETVPPADEAGDLPVPEPGVDPAPAQPQPQLVSPGQGALAVNFRPAKIAMSAVASGGGGFRRAASRYVGARGGARQSTRAAVAGRRATQRLAGFLGSLASQGLERTLAAFSLAGFLGRPAEVALAAIANVLAPAGATLEEAAARRATDDALCLLCDRLNVQGDLAKVDAVDAGVVRDVLEHSVAAYIYNRWLQEVGDRIERRAVTAEAAVTLEREVRQFVTETVRIDFSEIDVLHFDWGSHQGRQLVERIYNDAYSLLEE